MQLRKYLKFPLSKYLVAGLCIVVTFLLLSPILGDVWYPVHDTSHIARLYLMENAIRAGQLPPIWTSELNAGLGYPLFHFYAPLFYYLSLLIKVIVGSYFVAIKLVLFGALFSAMWGMYTLVKPWIGRGGAIVSALSFVTLPYMALNLYVRGAYAEFLAMSLLPWVFHIWQKVDTKKQVIAAAVVTTLFILSHNLIPLITVPFLAVWVIYHHRISLIKLLIPTLLTLLLSSFYIGPLLFERSFVQADSIAKTTDYSMHFVEPTQLWNSTWGFGGSAEGIEDGLSFKIGKIQVLLALLSLTLLIAKKRSWRVIYLAISLILAIFLTTSYSTFIWQSISVLPVVQFPWRYLSLIGFFVSVLAGLFFTRLKFAPLRWIVAGFIVILLLFINLKLFKPQTTFTTDQSLYTSTEFLATIPQTVKEFRPTWMGEESDYVFPAGSKSYYPTWQVEVNGGKVSTYPDENGLLTFDNPSSSEDIVYTQSHTLLEQISYSLTILGIILMFVYGKK
jgi:uncharacterized membrane protein